MIDGLQGLGLRLLAEGHSTPLLNIANAYMYATIQEAFEAIDRVGTILLLFRCNRPSSCSTCSSYTTTNLLRHICSLSYRGLGYTRSGCPYAASHRDRLHWQG